MARKTRKPPSPTDNTPPAPTTPLGDCPWCPVGTPLYVVAAGQRHYVRCVNCGARGPSRGSDKIAIHDFLTGINGGVE